MAGVRSTTHPNHVQVDLPLVRSKDKRDIGVLRLIRTYSWKLYDLNGRRLPTPQLEDVVTISLTNPAGEQVTWLEVPSRALFTELDPEEGRGEG